MKRTKASVNYRGTTSKTTNCHDCVHIQLHGAKNATCERVQGSVDRSHVCDLFERKSK